MTSVAVKLTHVSCWCGTPFMAPADMVEALRDRGVGDLHCPHGHSIVWNETTEAKRAKALASELEAKKRYCDTLSTRLSQVREEAAHERARANGYKGAMTKAKNRVGKGVCPCCNREFVRLKRHMASKHPEYADLTDEQRARNEDRPAKKAT